jgi:hypothetical protein
MEPDDELVPKKRSGNETEIIVIPISFIQYWNKWDGREKSPCKEPQNELL